MVSSQTKAAQHITTRIDWNSSVVRVHRTTARGGNLHAISYRQVSLVGALFTYYYFNIGWFQDRYFYGFFSAASIGILSRCIYTPFDRLSYFQYHRMDNLKITFFIHCQTNKFFFRSTSWVERRALLDREGRKKEGSRKRLNKWASRALYDIYENEWEIIFNNSFLLPSLQLHANSISNWKRSTLQLNGASMVEAPSIGFQTSSHCTRRQNDIIGRSALRNHYHSLVQVLL